MTKRKGNNRGEFHPTIFKLMATDDKLTAAAGLATIMEVFDQSPMAKPFRDALPKRSTLNKRSGGSYRLGLIQLNSFIYGHDCIDDLEEFRDDPLLEEVLQGKCVAPKTMGDFFRDFEPKNTQGMNDCLSSNARDIRGQLVEILPQEHKPKAALGLFR